MEIHTKPEFIKKLDTVEVWGSKYTFESWLAKKVTVDIRTGKYYYVGDLCFALVSYLDENGKNHIINEKQYFITR